MLEAALLQEIIPEGYRLSSQQERLWLLQKGERQTPYHAQCILRIEGSLDLVRLRLAIQYLVQRHEILRTTFHRMAGIAFPVQVVNDAKTVPFEYIDLSPTTRDDLEAKVQELCQELRQRPLVFDNDSLLDLRVIKLAATAHLVFIDLPALCADAATLKNLASEMGPIYTACSQGDALSEAPLQYADFAEWQYTISESGDSAGLAYWRAYGTDTLTPLLRANLPYEPMDTDTLGFRPRSIPLALSGELAGEIEKLAAQAAIPASTIVLGCWRIVLQRLTGMTDVLIGVAFDNRSYAEMREGLGLFAKYLPVYSEMPDACAFITLLRQLEEMLTDGAKWQEYFSWEALGLSNSASKEPLFFPFCFEFDEQPSAYTGGGITVQIEQWDACIERFKIKLVCLRKGESIDIALQYDASLYDQTAIETLARQLTTLLESAVRQPDTMLSRLTMLSEAEYHQIVSIFNQTNADCPHDLCLHELIESQVERTPQARALVCGGKSLTYAELDSSSNQ